jgi:ATP-dependent protease ClpP protease subunit
LVLRSLLAFVLVTGCAATPQSPSCPLNRRAKAPQAFHIGEVDSELAADFTAALRVAVEAGEPAFLVDIDSPGGEVFAGLEMIEAMRAAERAGTQVICTADGLAASMGFVLLQSCSVRLMTKRTALMAHEISAGGRGKAADFERLARRIADLDEWLFIVESAKLKMTLAEWKAYVHEHERFIGHEQALAIGAVDAVL